MSVAQRIKRAAHIAELRDNANELAANVRPAAVVEIPRRPSSRRGVDHRRLLLLLAQERRRRVRLIAELAK
jgi:hypothetical protein